ncbi:hypothetical protein ABPG75_011813 [Micractinium tetrahymenae]
MDSQQGAAQPPAVERMQTDGLQPGIQDPAKPFTFTGRVAYATPEEAAMVRNALAVDPELRPEAVTRELAVEGSSLVLHFAAVDMRTLRAAVCTFCDLLGLASRTLEAFGPGAIAAGAAAAGAMEQRGAAAASVQAQ